jgi:hypothetical protein
MPDALSVAELTAHDVELLPARTVLSMLSYGGIDITGPNGEPGTHGENGQSVRSFNFLGWIGWSNGPDPTAGNPA